MRRGSPEQGPGEGHSLARLAPAAVIVSGPPASGKTTLATALASALHYAIMDLDTVTGPLTRAALRAATGDETAIDSTAAVALRTPRYETLIDLAAANLAAGIGVVIAAPFTDGALVAGCGSKRSSAASARPSPSCTSTPRTTSCAAVWRAATRPATAPSCRGRPHGTSPATLVPEAIVIDGTHTDAGQLAEALAALTRPENRYPNKPQAASC